MDLTHSKSVEITTPSTDIYIHNSKSTDFIKPKGSVETLDGAPGK